MRNIGLVVALLVVVVFTTTVYAELCTCVAGGSQMYCVSESDITTIYGTVKRVHFDLEQFFDDSIILGGEVPCSLSVDNTQLKERTILTQYWVNPDGSLTLISSTYQMEVYGRKVCT